MGKMSHILFCQGEHICPWWFTYAIDNPLRRFIQPAEEILKNYIRASDTAIDIGCGFGYFTIAMAHLVGEAGHVIAVDLQEKMLQKVYKRAQRANLQSRIQLHQSTIDDLGIQVQADFILASWMVHEVKLKSDLMQKVASLLKPEAHFLMLEPKLHVSRQQFEQSCAEATQAGLVLDSRPEIALSQTALFQKI